MKNTQRTCLLFTLGVGLLSACDTPGPTQPLLSQTTDKSDVDFDEYIGGFVDFADTTDKTTRSALTDKLGAPTATEEKAMENIYDPSQTDRVETLKYNGLDITLYKIAGSNQEVIITEMLFSDPRYALKGDIKVGDPFSAVTLLLGSPDQINPDPDSDQTIALYCDSFTGQNCLSFYHKDSIIEKIVYQSYLE